MVGGRVDLKITIIPVNNDNKNNNNNNNTKIILTLDHKKNDGTNDDTNHRQELFVLASHPFFISRLGLLPCLRLRSRTNVWDGFDNDYEIYIHVFSKMLQKKQ